MANKGWRLMYFCLPWLGYISDWITATQSLLLRHSHFTSGVDSQWNSAFGRACGRTGVSGGRVIIRYDHWETTWACVTAFVIMTAEKKSRGKERWLKECLPSLCLWRKKYGDTRVFSKYVPWQQRRRKSWQRDGHEEKSAQRGCWQDVWGPSSPSLLTLLLRDIWRKCKWAGNRGTAWLYKQLHKHSHQNSHTEHSG